MLEKGKDALSAIPGPVPLKDKVVLLLNGTNRGGRSLALSLARNGADLAIVYRRAHAGQAQEMQSAVKTEGRRCLIIESEKDGAAFSSKAINQTLTGLGRLDIFIDFSSLSPDLLEPGEAKKGTGEERGQRKYGPFNNREMVSAVLDQLATRDLGSRQRDISNKRTQKEK
jgi:hypothetical protein